MATVEGPRDFDTRKYYRPGSRRSNTHPVARLSEHLRARLRNSETRGFHSRRRRSRQLRGMPSRMRQIAASAPRLLFGRSTRLRIRGGGPMAPLLSIALALIQNVADLGRVFVAPSHEPPAITFYFQNRHEETSLALLDEHDAVKPDALKELSHFVRCWRTQREKPMHPRLVEIVAALSRHFGDARIEVVSGYRARPYGAPHSKHFLGRAMDIHLNGIPAKVAARWVWANSRKVGVGFYPKQDFMHVDVRDQDVRWVDT